MANHALLRYLQTADETAAEIQHSDHEAFLLLEECADYLDTLLDSGMSEFDDVVWPLAANAQFLFLSAVRTALSGHLTAIFPQLRTSLESACYALVTSTDAKTARLWGQRNKSKNKRSLHRAAFSSAVTHAVKIIGEKCNVMDQYISGLYETSIDYGGHPNPRSIVRHIRTSKEDPRRVGIGCLYGLGSQVDTGLMACLDFGAGIIYLLRVSMRLDPFPGNNDSFLAVFMARKMACADRLNGAPIEYSEDMYEPLDPSD